MTVSQTMIKDQLQKIEGKHKERKKPIPKKKKKDTIPQRNDTYALIRCSSLSRASSSISMSKSSSSSSSSELFAATFFDFGRVGIARSQIK